ncbi:sterol glucosyltransferase [Xylariales sp. PMI_506]|nr:sterol glucosyltransferase [Xylariales sp. PMI_506]
MSKRRQSSRSFLDTEDEELPSYETALSSGFLQGNTNITDDGRVDIDPESRLFRTLSKFIPHDKKAYAIGTNASLFAIQNDQAPPAYVYEETGESSSSAALRNPSLLLPGRLRLNIVIQVVGSRGDVQPFVALGHELQRHGHRVRLATHDTFRDFVTQSSPGAGGKGGSLEFYPIGGDPAELMAYMVKNPGLIPNMKSLRAGDVQRKRSMIAGVLRGCWASCVEPDPVTGAPFVADAIIANPPSFAHVHCAQALGVPVHLMFTMPWTSTAAFPHPLANLGKVLKNPGIANYVSYAMVEWMTWQGLGDIINDWRKTLDLEPVPLTEGPGLTETLDIPVTYCWSPSLVPKPLDWPKHIDVCGFFFRDPPQYIPTEELELFLRKGPPPIYIGFGSIVVDDPPELTRTVLKAIKTAGVRAVISKGWSDLGDEDDVESDQILYLGDCPHEWLFPRVAAVVHHGGAGTTACGLRYGRPTTIIPFFGDQPFWGKMVAASGAGPEPIPYRSLNSALLALAISYCLTDEAAQAARELSRRMQAESGVQRAVQSFHDNLPASTVNCDIIKGRPAVWRYHYKGKKPLMLSGVAASVLADHLKIDLDKLKLYESNEINIENRRWDPITGTTSAAISTFSDMTTSTANIFVKPFQVSRSASIKSLTPASTSAASSSNIDLPRSREPCAEGELSRSKSVNSDIGMPPPHYPSHTDPEAVARDRQHERLKGATDGISNTANIAASMVLASASGVGGFFKSYSKGMMIDIPVAFAEGARAMPRLCGEEAADYGTVRDWKSGFAVSARSLALGLPEGFADLVTKPYDGARKDGALGVVTGFGKGLLGFSTKTTAAAVGMVAYPSLGIYKSVRRAIRDKTRKIIVRSRKEEGAYFASRLEDLRLVESMILDEFKMLVAG